MVNKPKAIGTAAESAVVRYLRDHGFPTIERRQLKGAKDEGDITGIPGVVVEVKGGEVAKLGQAKNVATWLEQTETERANARADIGILILQRRGFGLANAGEWWAIIDGAELNAYLPGHVRVSLWQMALFLRSSGYGEPL